MKGRKQRLTKCSPFSLLGGMFWVASQTASLVMQQLICEFCEDVEKLVRQYLIGRYFKKFAKRAIRKYGPFRQQNWKFKDSCFPQYDLSINFLKAHLVSFSFFLTDGAFTIILLHFLGWHDSIPLSGESGSRV